MIEAPAIETRALEKTYRTGFWMRPVPALRGLDMVVHKGEIFGFIGPNGAGKTTTIKILMGLHAATGGEARILGKDHRDPDSRARVGFLPERPYFYQYLTARELLHFYGQLLDLPERPRRDRVETLLRRVDLHRAADAPLGSYSKGMLQRVGLAQSLLHEPDLVVLDEPMSGLDPLGRALVRDIILEERAAGRTVFFSSHILHDVETLCDRVAVLVGGELRGIGTVPQLIGSQTRHVEVVILGAEDAPSLPGEELRRVLEDIGLRRHLRVDPDEVDRLIQAVHAAGGRILEVVPVRRTLEDVFLGEVKKARPDGATGAQGVG